MPQLPFKDKGPVEVIWDPAGANLKLSPFLGTISLKMADQVSPIEEEAWGSTPVDAVFTGTLATLDVPMNRSTMKQLQDLLAGVESTGSGATVFKVKAGCSMRADAKPMQIKPLCDNVPSVDTAEWITIFLGYPYREFDLGFDRDSQRIHMVHFYVFPDVHGQLYKVGA